MSVRRNYLAFDLGASSCRAMLGWLQDGRLEREELHRFRTPMLEVDGHLFWDLDRLWNELQTGLDRATARGGLQSLSVDSWGVDYVPLDVTGEPVRLPYAYRDPRTIGILGKVTERFSRASIYEATGIQFMEINTLYQVVADLLQEPDLYRRTHTRLLMADYFNHRFCGRALAESSLASTTQLMRAGDPHWASELMDALDLDAEGWPEIVPSCTRLGPVRGTEGVTVVAGCSHDTACAVAATPATATEADWAYISCGTWSLLGVELAAPELTPEAREAGFTNEAGLDGTIRFLKNMTGLWILQECERAWREAETEVEYDALLRAARAARQPDMLLDVRDPVFSQRGDMQAIIRSWCAEHEVPYPEDRGALVRLILESLADGHRRTLRELESVLRTHIRTLYVVGGGSRNDLLCELTAVRCGCRVVAGPAEATAIGNLLIQARALGDLDGSSIRSVSRAGADVRVFDPEVR